MLNWKRLILNDLMSDAGKRYKELFSSSMCVLRAVNKDDEQLVRVGAGHFRLNEYREKSALVMSAGGGAVF